MIFIDFGDNKKQFDKYVDYMKRSLEQLAFNKNFTKYNDAILGDIYEWFDDMYEKVKSNEIQDDNFLESFRLQETINGEEKRIEGMISLYTDSATVKERDSNDIDTGCELEKIRDRMIIQDKNQLSIMQHKGGALSIEGISGSGKTELLINKIISQTLQEVIDNNTKIAFVCFNKVLATELIEKVKGVANEIGFHKQIDTLLNVNLFIRYAWGRRGAPPETQGMYRYILNEYKEYDGIVDYYNEKMDNVYKDLLNKIEEKEGELPKLFDYMFIDERQDIGSNVIEVYQRITKNGLYIAGDDNQDVFDVNSTVPEYFKTIVLTEVYRNHPNTFMFAYGILMNLFCDNPKVPSKDFLNKTGFRENDGKLYRNLDNVSLKIFNDIKSKTMQFHQLKDATKSGIIDGIISCIKDIKDKFPTAKNSDFAIVFPGKRKVTSKGKEIKTTDIFALEIQPKFSRIVKTATESEDGKIKKLNNLEEYAFHIYDEKYNSSKDKFRRDKQGNFLYKKFGRKPFLCDYLEKEFGNKNFDTNKDTVSGITGNGNTDYISYSAVHFGTLEEQKFLPKRDKIYLTNENNIKGMEFPFVIIVLNDDEKQLMRKEKDFNKTLYMLITRSKFQTHLLMNDEKLL